MSDTQWRRVNEIECYKQKTFNLSRTDRIGRVVSKTFDLIQTIIRDGPNAETLVHDVESLKTEQVNAMKWDANQSDQFRSILYNVSSSLGSMVESIHERNVTEKSYENYFMIDNIKVEPTDPHEDHLFTKNDGRSYGNIDTEFQNSEDAIVAERSTVMEDAVNRSDAVDPSANSKESTRKRPRSVIFPKVNYDEEAEGEDSDEGPSTPTTPGHLTCDHCDRLFPNTAALKRHRIIHEGIRCGDCGYRFKSMSNLRKHYAEYHPGKRAKAAQDQSAYASLKCAQCDYTAPDYSSHVIHQRKHTGEKPYACDKCASKFAETGSLYRHLRDSHNEKPYKCEKCGMKFGRRAEKWAHKKSKHRH